MGNDNSATEMNHCRVKFEIGKLLVGLKTIERQTWQLLSNKQISHESHVLVKRTGLVTCVGLTMITIRGRKTLKVKKASIMAAEC